MTFRIVFLTKWTHLESILSIENIYFVFVLFCFIILLFQTLTSVLVVNVVRPPKDVRTTEEVSFVSQV